VDLPGETEETHEELVTVLILLTVNSDSFLKQPIFAVETHWLHARWVTEFREQFRPWFSSVLQQMLSWFVTAAAGLRSSELMSTA
jgi:DNA-binding SARP family transcriptional activator